MAKTLFKEISYSLSKLIGDIAMGQIGLPDLQRPFVWPNKKVRDLFDSMYRGYPVGYLLFWKNAAAEQKRTIGVGPRQMIPDLLVIDGQQRLTSLFSVLRGVPVKRDNFREEKISIAFRPLDGGFEVADAAIRKDATWIPDISVLWAKETDIFELADGYLDRVGKGREVAAEEKRSIRGAIQRLFSLEAFPFTALELAGDLNEEQVADVFVRINSKGTPLNQADFILTLMSVFQDAQRTQLEEFCRLTQIPSAGEASPFNYFIQPEPDHLLRVSVGLGFRRARLQHVYSILRGKDLETGEYSDERRDRQFAILQEAQTASLDLQSWHDFLKCLVRAGYRQGRVVSSKNALLYTYVFYLLGKHDYGLDAYTLRNVIARWFFFVALTGRYTDSPETRMEQDLADLRGVKDASGFIDRLDRTIRTSLTPDYWGITLPNELTSSSARSPGLFAYYAALNLLDAKVLFSKMKVSELMDPATKAKKSALERHHLFPRNHLRKKVTKARREINQIANFALLEWPDNIKISDEPPASYFPKFAKRFPERELAPMMRWHALPEGWHEMEYFAFLKERRRLMADVIREGYEILVGAPEEISAEPLAEVAEASIAWSPPPPTEAHLFDDPAERVLALLPSDVEAIVRDLLEEAPIGTEQLIADVNAYTSTLEELAEVEEFLDLDTARRVADQCLRLLEGMNDETSDSERRLIQAAALYYILDDDAEGDVGSIIGFDDDHQVVEAVSSVVNTAARATA